MKYLIGLALPILAAGCLYAPVGGEATLTAQLRERWESEMNPARHRVCRVDTPAESPQNLPQTPPAERPTAPPDDVDTTPLPIAPAIPQGVDRVVITLDRYRPEIDAALDALKAAGGWSIGAEPTDLIQVIKGDELAAYKLEGGKPIRTWDPKQSPLDQWTIGWLFYGKDNRKVATPANNGYPLRTSRQTRYTETSGTKAGMIAHIQGHHRGGFDYGWLNSLSMEELTSLHGDQHDRAVKEAYVVRPAPKQATKVQTGRVTPGRY